KLLAGCLEDDGLLSIMTLFHPLDDQEFLDWYYMRDMSHISFYTSDTMKVISGIAGLDLVFTDNRRYTSFRLKR
ncbi:MAG: class I SAM-dependent methyltransferase, partial [Thermotogaceae bacterium]|nr:class I SAM-dependent methyltransferase [Thermotogaceae bacterium]